MQMVIMHINLSIIETGLLFPTIHIEQNFLLRGPNHMVSLILLESVVSALEDDAERMMSTGNSTHNLQPYFPVTISTLTELLISGIITLMHEGATLKIMINKIYLIHSVLIHQSQNFLNRSCTLSIYFGQPYQMYLFTGSSAFMIVVPITTEHSSSSRGHITG
jgi:hypothetical protein